MARVLGIDPGLRRTGYACLEEASGAGGGLARVIEGGVLKLNERSDVASRLVELERDLVEVIERVRPTELVVEKLYAHYKHPTTAIVMGHARGVVLLAGRRAGVEVGELGATEVKRSVTGNGHASKEQVQSAIKVQLGLAEEPRPNDLADAMAIALCALMRRRFTARGSGEGRVGVAGL